MKTRSPSKSDPAALERRVGQLEARNLELARTLQIIEEARAALADQYDFAPVGLVTLDAKGCIRAMNLTASRLMGRKRAELLGMPFLTCISKPHSRRFLRHLRRCNHAKTEVACTLELRAAGRRLLPVELRSRPVPDPRRGDIVFRTAITDISERLRTEVRESEEIYREVVELSPDGIFVLIDGDIVFANRAAAGFCGAGKAVDLLGRQIVDLIRPVSRKTWIEYILNISSAGRKSPLEVRFVRPDETKVEVDVIAHDFAYNEDRAVLILARDVTRRREAERQVLAVSEREKERFGRDLHDSLCQSLAGAACMTEALRNGLRKTSTRLAGNANEIADVIRDCIEEARGMAKGLYPVSMEKNGLVPALYELAGDVSRRSGIECSVQCDDALAIGDIGVAMNLYRIAQEAVRNAIRHGRAKSVSIQLVQQNGKTTLTLRDDGRGFPAKPKETGLGLYTMRYRASMIGGWLNVRPNGARGTSVSCTFPTRKEQP